MIKQRTDSLKTLIKLTNSRKTDKEKTKKIQIIDIRNETGAITKNPIDIKVIRIQYYQQLYIHKFYIYHRRNELILQKAELPQLT